MIHTIHEERKEILAIPQGTCYPLLVVLVLVCAFGDKPPSARSFGEERFANV